MNRCIGGGCDALTPTRGGDLTARAAPASPMRGDSRIGRVADSPSERTPSQMTITDSVESRIDGLDWDALGARLDGRASRSPSPC